MTDILNLALTGLVFFSGGGADGSILPTAMRIPEYEQKQEIVSVRLTGYNAVAEQTNAEPHITASGVRSNPDVIIARSRDMAEELPYGTVVALYAPSEASTCGFSKVKHFVGYRVVADTMHKRKIRQMDVMFDVNDTVLLGDKHINPATVMGICNVNVRVVGSIDIADIPQTQSELAMRIHGRELSIR